MKYEKLKYIIGADQDRISFSIRLSFWDIVRALVGFTIDVQLGIPREDEI